MKKKENTDNMLSFHLQLLSKTIDMNSYPFIQLVITNQLSYEEYTELLQLVHTLQGKYEEQKEEGLMNFTPLLIHFAGMLNPKLNPTKTIYALYKENMFTELMRTFISIIEENK